MIKSFLQRIRSLSIINFLRYPMAWKKHIVSDFFNMYIFRSKIKGQTPFGFGLVGRKYIENKLMIQGKYEENELKIIEEYLQKADVFIDVGANIGYYSCLALNLGKHVVAFEPQWQNLECLYENLFNNEWYNAEVFPVGLSSRPGLVELYGASGLCASLVKDWAGYPNRFRQIVPVNTLDNIIADRFNGKRLFIKIDVEGAEFDVLRGAINTLMMIPHPTWFIEINLSLFCPGGRNPNYKAIFDLFWENGYQVKLANENQTIIKPQDFKLWLEDYKGDQKIFNYIFCPVKK